MKIDEVKGVFYKGCKLKFTNIFYTFRLIWVKFGMGDVHKILLHNCECHENWLVESRTLCTIVS
jgi:hypothetical protein